MSEGHNEKEIKPMENRFNAHMSHPFYEQSKKFWEDVRIGQIRKGSEKYPEPFTPDSWTNEELAIHAMQENVDQSHYISGMRDRMLMQEQTIKDQQREINELRLRLNEYE